MRADNHKAAPAMKSNLKSAHKIAATIATGALTEKQKRKAVSNWAKCMKAVLKGRN